MKITINPQEIPEIIGVLKELVTPPIIKPADSSEEAEETSDALLVKFLRKSLEEAQLEPSVGLLNDILKIIKTEYDEFINMLKLKYTNMADYQAMSYAAAARKAQQYIGILTNTKENNEYISDFVKALEVACFNMLPAHKELMFEGLTETCKKDPIVFMGLSYSANSVKAAKKEADKNKENLPRESNEHDEIFRVFYRFIEDVDDSYEINLDDPQTYDLENSKNHYSPYRVNIDMSEDTRILFAVERLAEKKGYYSNMKMSKDLFCFRFQFVNGDLKKIYMTDKFADIQIANDTITALISKLEKAVEDFKPEIIIHKVDEHNVHI